MKYYLALLVACLGLFNPLMVSAVGQVELLATYPSDATAFTQGLELDQHGNLLISTGQYGESVIAHLDLKKGQLNEVRPLNKQYFGEGLTETPFGIWQLTWREGVAFLREAESLEEIRQATYTGEGWGLAYDEKLQVVWMSDGSATLQQRHAETFEKVDTLKVTYQGKPVERLNELEYANGYLYANIWQTYIIVKIDPTSGKVVAQYDLQAIVQAAEVTPIQRARMDVLNGIAHIEGDKFYVTGKRYPLVFEVVLSE
ncbi:glutaminyl-peptide cyclotransferase [Aerococcaceae bacterium NML180378]|nr:glutaminyl-peptide cyclotransferase [Aerococcaceae bacterium NML180378]